MFFIKKSSFFYLQSLFLQTIFSHKGFLAFFDGFDCSFVKKISFFNNVSFFNFVGFFLSSKFISFFVKKTGLNFFCFFKPSVFFIKGIVLVDFYRFLKLSFNFFLIGFSFDFIFFNNFYFNKLFDFSFLFFNFYFFFIFIFQNLVFIFFFSSCLLL